MKRSAAPLLLLSLLSACAAHQPQEVRVVVIRETPAVPSNAEAAPAAKNVTVGEPQVSEAPNRSAPNPAPPAKATPSRPMAPPHSVSPSLRSPSSVSAMPVAAASDCYVTRHATGVLDGQCQGFDVLLFAGFSAGPKASMLSSIVGDRTGQWSQKTRVVVAGRRVQAWERGRREQEEVIRPFGGVSYRDKPGGGFERRGLFAKFKTPKSGIVGAYCHGPADQYSTEKCTAVLSRIAREGIPGGPVTSSELYVAGVHLDLHKKKCWASNTKRVYCFLDGGMDWYEGSADEMRRREATVIANSHLAGGAEHPSQRPARIERTACNIGKTPSACARVTLFGALDKPSKYYYFAHVQAGNTVTLAHCQRWAIGGNREASLPCKQLFGSFLE